MKQAWTHLGGEVAGAPLDEDHGSANLRRVLEHAAALHRARHRQRELPAVHAADLTPKRRLHDLPNSGAFSLGAPIGVGQNRIACGLKIGLQR